jgi:hypothetical protein
LLAEKVYPRGQIKNRCMLLDVCAFVALETQSRRYHSLDSFISDCLKVSVLGLSIDPGCETSGKV